MASGLVPISDYALRGENYYWRKAKEFGISDKDLSAAGISDNRVWVHADIIGSLIRVNTEIAHHGDWSLRLHILDGYRSLAAYQLAERAMNEKFGKMGTRRVLNMHDMPHASGKSVDVALWCTKTGALVPTRSFYHGLDAYFADFYKYSNKLEEKEFHRRQVFLIGKMMGQGFRLGSKREYFHFNHEPGSPPNYP